MIESQREVDQQKFMLNNSITISPTSDEEMRHAWNTSNDISSSNEL